tara:strand:- start:20 stop:460 length:441 start_codon:yes stop_codon:yes gene_type:complete
MAVTFTNNWLNILNKLQNILRTEFKNALPVYVGHEEDRAGNQYLRLDPASSELLEYNVNSETREFTINFFYVFSGAQNIKGGSLDHVLRYVSRIEALIHDNISMELSDSSSVLNCRLESTELNTDDDESTYVVEWVYKCQHLGNMG